MDAKVSRLASVDPNANIADGVEIGPFCVIGPDVSIGSGTRLRNNVTVTGRVTIGCENDIFPYVVIGAEPQDVSYRGSPTIVEIGDGNVFRESVTINRATEKEDGITSVGNECYMMACSHVAHDCRVGDRVILANATLLGGHVHVQSDATISGGVAVHHFCTVGQFSFVGGLSRVLHDVPPYMLADGNPARPRCANLVALKRNNFSREEVKALSDAHRLLYRAKVGLDQAREILRSKDCLRPCVNELLSFVAGQQEGPHGRGREGKRAA